MIRKKITRVTFGIAICIGMILFVSNTYGQTVQSLDSSTTMSFDSINYLVEQIYQNKAILTSRDSSDLKAHSRWNHFWETRLNKDGTIGYTDGPDSFFTTCPPLGNWEAKGPFSIPSNANGIGRIQSIAVYGQNHNIIYIGSNTGGVFKTTDLGQTWESAFDSESIRVPGLGVLDIVIHPTNPNIVLIATGLSSPINSRYGAGIYKTIDGGASWVNVSSGFNVHPDHPTYEIVTDLEFHPTNPNIVFATNEDQLMKSIDGGNTFTTFRTNPNGQHFEWIKLIKSGTDYLLYATTKKDDSHPVAQLWRCLLNTNYWSNITGPSMIGKRLYIDVTPASPNNLYVEYNYANHVSKLFISTNRGNTFTTQTINISGQNFWKNALAVSPVDPSILFIGGVHTHKFKNAGALFQTSYNHHMDVRAFEYISGSVNGTNDSILVGHDGGISLIVGSSRFNRTNIKLNISQVYSGAVKASGTPIVAIGTQDNGTTILNGNTWSYLRGGDGGTCLFTRFNNEDHVLNIANSRLYVNNLTTGSSTFIEDVCLGSNSGSGPYCWGFNTMVRPFMINPQNPKSFYYSIKNLQRFDLGSNNVGSSKTTLTNSLDIGKHKINSMAMSYTDSNIIYVGTGFSETSNTIVDSCLYKTVDGGITWVSISPPGPAVWSATITSIVVNPTNHNEVWVSYGGFNDSMRVYFTSNGGATWINYSDGLQSFPVNQLIYEEGSSNRLYAATDIGVFYRDSSMPQWECLNQGLPSVITTSLSINYCVRKLYASTFGRGLWSADLLPNQSAYLAVGSASGTTWSTDMTIKQDVHVTSGNILTISNATINMTAGTKFVVEQGAKLFLTNAKLTNECGAFWSGIEVWGNSLTNTQYCSPGSSCLMGQLTMNNSTIENADNAVRLWKPNDWVKIGGMIFALNSTFLNNRRDVEFMAFENHYNFGSNSGNVAPYRSWFSKCTFEIDQNYLFDVKAPQQARVSLWKVRGIKFSGCAFKNSTGEIQNLVGIGSLDANYTVKQACTGFYPCTTPIASTFTGLKAGICATGSGQNYSFTVDNATFTDNEYGILTASVNEAVITRNTFTPYVAGATFYDLLYLNTTAIHMEVSDDYTIQENHITGIQPGFAIPGQPSILSYSRGIVLSNTGDGSNKVYKNTLIYLDQANVAYGLNHDPANPEDGLQYECNNITQSVIADINIYGPNAGIAINQGALNDAADNTFSTSIQTLTGHINNNSSQLQPLNYYYHSYQTGYNFEPTMISNTVITKAATDDDPYVESGSCKTKLPIANQDLPGKLDGVDVLGEWLKASNGKNGYYQAKYVYTALVDGGDTYGLLNTVQNTNSQTAWDIRTDLINASPISIEVVNQTIDDAFLSNALLHDVFMVNPHAVRDEGVMYKLENKTNPMPAYMINTLLGIYEAQTQKDILEAEMANEMQKAFEAARFLQWNWQADTNKPLNDSVLALMDTLNTPAAEWIKVAHQFSKGNYGEGQVLINAMPSKFTFNMYENDVYTELSSYYTTYTSMLNAGPSSFTNPTPAQLTNLQTLAADTTTKAGRMAQNLVLFAEGKLFWPTLPAAPQNKKEEKNPRAKRPEVVAQMAKVYPNPANGYVTIEFTQLESKQAVYISVINNTGTQVLSHRETMNPGGLINLVTQSLASGQYYVLIYSNNKLLQKQTIEIIH